jgi:hypothetical protein
MTIENLNKGDTLILGCKGEQFLATVSLASPNGKSLVVLFNAMIDGHLGMMPVTVDERGDYCSLINRVPITLRFPEGAGELATLRRNEK